MGIICVLLSNQHRRDLALTVIEVCPQLSAAIRLLLHVRVSLPVSMRFDGHRVNRGVSSFPVSPSGRVILEAVCFRSLLGCTSLSILTGTATNVVIAVVCGDKRRGAKTAPRLASPPPLPGAQGRGTGEPSEAAPHSQHRGSGYQMTSRRQDRRAPAPSTALGASARAPAL